VQRWDKRWGLDPDWRNSQEVTIASLERFKEERGGEHAAGRGCKREGKQNAIREYRLAVWSSAMRGNKENRDPKKI